MYRYRNRTRYGWSGRFYPMRTRRSYRIQTAWPAIGVLLAAGFALQALAALVTALTILLFAFVVITLTAVGLVVLIVGAAYFIPDTRRALLQARERVLMTVRALRR